MNAGTPHEFDVEQYAAEHQQPSEAESAVLTILLFAAMVVFAIGCTMFGWFG
ncbi:hypothetical protein [Propioniciclava sinopodophylli]|uniref:hypothetical protein n=1 Tax=Propioniciclava sinopodophylli TaxID=1837344 RepID=UPI0017778039|nr:hypothetical protein [Propioniciclava sinopodophylli]HHU38626.1 hypothetical protein [Propionibacterium sp.]